MSIINVNMKYQENIVYCYTDIHIYVICCNNKILILKSMINGNMKYLKKIMYIAVHLVILNVKCCNIKVLIEINIY